MPSTRDLILRSATAQAPSRRRLRRLLRTSSRLEGRRGADARPAQGRARGVWKTDGRAGPLGYNHGMSRFPIAWPGVPLALLSAGLFGISMPLAKVLLGEGVSPWLLAGLLYLGSGLGLAVLQLARKAVGASLAEAPLRRADLPWLALVVLSGGVVAPVLLMLGLAMTPASTASARNGSCLFSIEMMPS